MYSEIIDDGEEEEPVWYNFIVNDDLETWAIIATYEEDFSVFYLWTPDDNTCILTPDWKNPDNQEENIWGFFVSDWENSCPYIEENGWTYTWYTYDENS
jgi:hypothetical protein